MMYMTISLSAIIALATSTAYADDLEKYREESRGVVGPFMQKLAAENKKAVSEGGGASAIKACKEIAPAMSGEISRQSGWKLTRVSLKVRNPLLGTPDTWEQKVLQDFEARASKGEKPETLETAEVVQEPAGTYFRFMKAITLQPGCLACHGDSTQMPGDVKARLGEDYPHDQARGYSAGQIRGAVSIKRPL